MKLVINKCYGGFGLSKEAMEKYAERKGIDITIADHSSIGFTAFKCKPDELPEVLKTVGYPRPKGYSEAYNSIESLYDRDIPRDDADLVAIVEELGSEASSGRFAALQIVEIPDGVSWTIEEYDGQEWVAETHQTWG